MRCKHCGSSRHADEFCPILAKVRLMEQGIPPEALFDAVVQEEELKDLLKDPAKFIKAKRNRN
mgnify:CR=1 FL=1